MLSDEASADRLIAWSVLMHLMALGAFWRGAGPGPNGEGLGEVLMHLMVLGAF